MTEVSFLAMEWVNVEDSMWSLRVSSLDSIETLIESDFDEVDPFMSHYEEVGSPLKER